MAARRPPGGNAVLEGISVVGGHLVVLTAAVVICAEWFCTRVVCLFSWKRLWKKYYLGLCRQELELTVVFILD